jgi:hypothetical protein
MWVFILQMATHTKSWKNTEELLLLMKDVVQGWNEGGVAKI